VEDRGKMKNKTRITTITLIVLAIFISFGCQIASQTQPAPESDPASDAEPVSPPTDVPTETPLPEPDLTSAVLMLEDLPPGFEEFTPADMGLTLDDFSDETFQPKEVFIFLNSEDFQMVFGFNFLLTSKLDRASFDVGISQPDVTLPALINGLGSENVQDEKILDGFDGIGEKQIGMSMIADLEGVPLQVEVLMFRRETVGAIVMSMVLEGDSPNITLHDLGMKLDQNIQESLQAIQ
jgi:hypothetical protein